MRGTIIKRVNSYRIKVSLGKDSETGKYKSYFETVNGNKRDAEQRLNQVINDIDKGVFIRPSRMLFKEYLESWLNDYCAPTLSPRTYQLYKYICEKHIFPELGNIPLLDLKPQHLQKLYTNKFIKKRGGGIERKVRIFIFRKSIRDTW